MIYNITKSQSPGTENLRYLEAQKKRQTKNENNKEKILKTDKCNVIQMTYVKMCFTSYLNLLSANCTKWSNTLKQFVGKLPANWWVCLTILWDWHFKGLYSLWLQKVWIWCNGLKDKDLNTSRRVHGFSIT